MQYLKEGISLARWEVSLFYRRFLCSLSWERSAPAEGSHCPEVGEGCQKASTARPRGERCARSEVSPRRRDCSVPLAASAVGSSCGQRLSFKRDFRSVAEEPCKRVGVIVGC